MARTSPTQRSIAHAKREGLSAAVVEKWIPVPAHPAGGIRRDLWSWGDLIVVGASSLPVIVQTTSGSNAAARVSKLLDPEAVSDAHLLALMRWQASGCGLEVWSWAKRGARGKRKLWSLRRVPVDLRSVLLEGGRSVPEEEGPAEAPRLRLEAPAGLFPD